MGERCHKQAATDDWERRRARDTRNSTDGILLVTGILLFVGVAHQVRSGLTRQRRSPASRRAHKIIGYAVLLLALPHMPLGVIDAVEVLFG